MTPRQNGKEKLRETLSQGWCWGKTPQPVHPKGQSEACIRVIWRASYNGDSRAWTLKRRGQHCILSKPPVASEALGLCLKPSPLHSGIPPPPQDWSQAWEVGGRTGSNPFPCCPPYHLSSSSGKPVFQLSLGQQQWEKVTSWKVTYLRHDHTLPVSQSLWEIYFQLREEQTAFLGMKGLGYELGSL